MKRGKGHARYTLVAIGLVVAVTAGVLVVAHARTVGKPLSVARVAAESEPTKLLAASGASCGVELWALKTMTDPLAGMVDMAPLPTTIAAVNALPRPANSTSRAGDQFELRTWTITATLTGYSLEVDSDYHLVLSAGGKTMIAEIPNPACMAGSSVLALVAGARAGFEHAHPQAAECFNCLAQTVTLWGVGFFDFAHGQNGVAANAAEIHPVLGFAVGGSPLPVPITTTTSTTSPTTTTAPTPGPVANGCKKWPGRHYLDGRYHAGCREGYYTTP